MIIIGLLSGFVVGLVVGHRLWCPKCGVKRGRWGEMNKAEHEELARRIADKLTVNWLGETGCTPEAAEENKLTVAEVLREYLGGTR